MTDSELLGPTIEHLTALTAESVRTSIEAHATGTDADMITAVEAARAVDRQVTHIAELAAR